MACCLEVVLFAYSSQKTFPWIIEVFKLQPYGFYKACTFIAISYVKSNTTRDQTEDRVKLFMRHVL